MLDTTKWDFRRSMMGQKWLAWTDKGVTLDSRRTGTEIDIMESFKPVKIVEHFLHTGGYGLDRVSVGVGEKTDIDKTVFHRFGVL